MIGRNNINTIIRRRYKGKDEVVAQTAAILTTRAPLRVDVDVTTGIFFILNQWYYELYETYSIFFTQMA